MPVEEQEPQVCQAGAEDAEHDFAIGEVGGEDEFEGAPLFLLGNGAGDVGRRDDDDRGQLHAEEGAEKGFGELRELLHIHANIVEHLPKLGVGEPGRVEEEEGEEKEAAVEEAMADAEPLASGAEEVVHEHGAAELRQEPAEQQQCGQHQQSGEEAAMDREGLRPHAEQGQGANHQDGEQEPVLPGPVAEELGDRVGPSVFGCSR